jgi:hypothetical protein
MTLEKLEAEVLLLPKDAQAELLARLLVHLGQICEIDQETASVWVEEADRRDQEMNSHQVANVPAQEVFQRVRALLQ